MTRGLSTTADRSLVHSWPYSFVFNGLGRISAPGQTQRPNTHPLGDFCPGRTLVVPTVVDREKPLRYFNALLFEIRIACQKSNHGTQRNARLIILDSPCDERHCK